MLDIEMRNERNIRSSRRDVVIVAEKRCTAKPKYLENGTERKWNENV